MRSTAASPAGGSGAARTLARELARRAQTLRLAAREDLDARGVRSLLHPLHAALGPGRSADDLADAFAQTAALGLLAARWASRREPRRFDRGRALAHLPSTCPLLDVVIRAVADRGSAPGIGAILDELVTLLDPFDLDAALGGRAGANPVFHVYEPFLQAYDAGTRRTRGVYFTPEPVVGFLVRSVDDALRREIGLADGLADTATWADLARRDPRFPVPPEVDPAAPFVRILDPATGTGAFLLAVVDAVHATLQARWSAEGADAPTRARRWIEYVPRSLLPRLRAFEVMAAPHAIAHLELGLKLAETGYRLRPDDRVHILLANALDPPPAEAACAPVTVILGNPPYAKRSANRGPHAEALVQPYKADVAGEANVQPLSDDYVKFIAHAAATCGAAGVIALVTNRGYTTGLIHRGMRRRLLDAHASVHVLDLHGDTNVGESPPPGRANENVFVITQGVAVLLLVRAPAAEQRVRFGELWGTRAEKLAALSRASIADLATVPLAPAAPHYFFAPRDFSSAGELSAWAPFDALFGTFGMGIKSRRDHFLIAFDRDELAARFRRVAGDEPPARLAEDLGVVESEPWSIDRMRRLVRRVGVEEGIRPILYRPFDQRFVWYHREAIERGDARWPVMRHVLDGGLSILTSRQTTQAEFTAAFVARGLSEMKAAESSRGSYAFPLFLVEGGVVTPNLRPGVDHGALAGAPPIAVARYLYAVLHAPSYRARYRELLRIGFPRIPFTPRAALADALVVLGARLLALHLLEDDPAEGGEPTLETAGDLGVARGAPWFAGGRVHVNARTWFEPVEEDVWSFVIGGYPVCERWLKERRGRTLTAADVAHVRHMVAAVRGTIAIMRRIDEAIDAHGGWPEAFGGALQRA